MSEVSTGFELIAGIVRVLESDGKTVGTGFVVNAGGDSLIVTCAHVVELAKSGPGRSIALTFSPFDLDRSAEKYSAIVEPACWRDADAEDIAVLHLEEPLPRGVEPLRLGSSLGSEDHVFQSYGFGEAKPTDGLWGKCTVLGPTRENSFPVWQMDSGEVSLGFSGAPVWDEKLQVVIGMVMSISRPDRAERQTRANFVIPAETLSRVCPDLRLTDECPYRGLSTFTEQDRVVFFGREQAIQELLKKLRANPQLLTVFGPSGSGKSSLVRAGVIPRLQEEHRPQGKDWGVIVTRPADNPFKQFSAQGLAVEPGGLLGGVRGWLTQHPDNQRLLLVIDQFEELFVTCPEAQRRLFIKQLTQLRNEPFVTVIIVMRNDFYSQFVEHEALREWLAMSGGAIDIPQTLKRSDLLDIILRPAERSRLRFQEVLPDLIIRDVMEESPHPGDEDEETAQCTVLPLLEFVLMQVWERRQQGVLTSESYRAIGGVAGGLTQWANHVLARLGEGRLPLVERVFLALVHLGDETSRQPDSRQPASLASLIALGHNDGEHVSLQEVIQELVDARLLVIHGDRQRHEATIEIIHEALLQHWPALQYWIAKDRRFLQWRQELEQRAQAWIQTNLEDLSQRDEGRLLRGRDLAEAEDILNTRGDELTARQREYILASKEQMTDELEKERQRATELSAALEIAQRQKQMALARQLATQAELIRNHQPPLSLLLAVESIQRFHCVEADQALRNGLTYIGCLTNSLKHKGIICVVAVSQHGRCIATGSNDKRAKVWDITDSQTSDAPPPIILPHEDEVHLITFSLDGQYLATASNDKRVRVWDITGKRILATLPHSNSVNALAFSPDGLYLATAENDPVAKIWEWRTETLRFKLPHNGNVNNGIINSLIFSHDGSYLATASDDCTAKVWETTAWRLHHQLEHTDMVLAVAFNHNSSYLASASWDRTAAVWEASSGKQINRFRHVDNVSTVTFSPDDRYLATTSSKVALVWHTTRGYVAAYLPHPGRVNAATFSPDSRTLVTACDDRAARIWEIASNHQIARFDHPSVVRTATFTPTGSNVVTASDDNEARIWKTDRGDEYLRLMHAGGVNAVTFTAMGTHIATASDDCTARVWDVTTGKEIRSIQHDDRVNSVVFSHDGYYLATASDDCIARVLRIPDGDEVLSLRIPHTGKVNAVTFSRYGHYLATASSDGKAGLQSLTEDKPLKYLPHGLGVNSIDFSPDEHLIATASTDGFAYIWNIADGSRRKLPHDGEVLTTMFSANGHYLATASGDRLVRLWRIDGMSAELIHYLPIEDITKTMGLSPDGRNLVAIGGGGPQRGVWDISGATPIRHFGFTYEAPVTAIAFSTSSRNTNSEYLVTGHRDGIAIFWQITDGRQLARVTHSHKREVRAVTFSPDGRYIATASADGTAVVWLWRPEDLIAATRSRVNRDLTKEERRQYLPDELYLYKTFPDLP